MKKRMPNHEKDFTIFTPIAMSLVTLGPVGWHIIDIATGDHSRLLSVFLVSIVTTILSTITWAYYIYCHKSQKGDDR
jgi:hypothetical protein